jgi:cation:H+ antiporter
LDLLTFDSLTPAIVVLGVGALLLITAGVRFTKVVDELADRTGIGEAIAGAVLLGAATSLPGLVTTVTGAAQGEAGFAISNAVGGIAAQTTFLVIADFFHRKANLEHAAASLPNIVQTMVLMAMIGLVLASSGGPDVTFGWIHPASVVLVLVYMYGLVLSRRSRRSPMWEPLRTDETVIDEEEPDVEPSASLPRLWSEFAGLALVVGAVGFAIGRAGLGLAQQTGLSGSVVGALFTSVITSLPELVTVLTAVRIGALTLAVSDIVGGNTFDVLFVAAADVFFAGGSVYHAADTQAIFLMALTVVLTSLLAAGMLEREKRHIGFEGVAILAFYLAGAAALFVM